MSRIFYECDRRKCDDCSFPMCHLTEDINHAVTFYKDAGKYIQSADTGAIGMCKKCKHRRSDKKCGNDKSPYYDGISIGCHWFEEKIETVRYGKWIAKSNPNYSPFDPCSSEEIHICNQCGYEQEFGTNFCPHCGAKMDGEEKEE